MSNKKILRGINWELLREQKLDLLNVIDLHQSETDEAAKKQTESLTGILHLIDRIQDTAVDEEGYDEKEVFGDLGEEE